MAAVEIHEVTKTFGPQTAVDRLSLSVPEQSIYGFIGPNGSGKTTTLRMIMRILHPDSGSIRVLGDESWKAVNDRVGYLPEERGLYKQMSVRDILKYYAVLKGMRDSRREIETWLERLGLAAHAGKKVAALSKGMSQKVQFIATVVARPALVLLDEPFTGVDPIAIKDIQDIIAHLKERDIGILITDHNVQATLKITERSYIIADGEIKVCRECYSTATAMLSTLRRPAILEPEPASPRQFSPDRFAT